MPHTFTRTRSTVSEKELQSVIKMKLKLKDLPMNVTFHDLGFTNAQLQLIQNALVKAFNRTVPTIFFSDTVYTLHQRI